MGKRFLSIYILPLVLILVGIAPCYWFVKFVLKIDVGGSSSARVFSALVFMVAYAMFIMISIWRERAKDEREYEEMCIKFFLAYGKGLAFWIFVSLGLCMFLAFLTLIV